MLTPRLLLLLLLSSVGCTEPSAPPEGATPPAEPTPEPPEPVQVAAFSVAPRGAGGVQPLVAGIPFAAGDVATPVALTLRAAEDLPARWRPLSLWADGTVRWAEVQAEVPLPPGGEDLSLTVWTGAGPEPQTPAPGLPAMRVEVVRASGTLTFPLKNAEVEQDGLRLRWSVAELAAGRRRLALSVAELGGGEQWSRISLLLDDDAAVDLSAAGAGGAGIGDLALAIPLFEERGPTAIEQTADGVALHLYAPDPAALPLAADPHLEISYRVVFQQGIGPAELVARVAAPLRPRFDLPALAATGAGGDLGPVGAATAYDEALAASVANLRLAQGPDRPEHRGPRAWGDFRAAEGASLSYAGYMNQEYDPASALVQYALRAGDAAAWDSALQMARQYADTLSPEGGSYQPRSTKHAVVGTVAEAHVPAITAALRGPGGAPLSRAELEAAIEQTLGAGSAADAVAWYDRWAQGSDEEREQATIGYMAWLLANAGEGQATSGDAEVLSCVTALWPDADPGAPRVRDLAAAAYCARGLAPVPSRPSFDAVFDPFFARYGGSWQDDGPDPFPVFHHFVVPDRQAAHGGGHSLLEMLVWGYLLSGEEELRAAALRAASFHVADGEVIDRGFATIEANLEQQGRAWVRNLGWPLVNLGAARLLTMGGQEPELDAELLAGADAILDFLATLEPSQYKSSIHVAVVSEGLARWHRQTGDPRASELLVQLIEGWSADGDAAPEVVDPMWDEAAGGWRKEPGEAVVSGISCQLIYGAAYAALASGDAELERKTALNFETHCPIKKGDAKPFAMGYRNSQRALALPWFEAP